MTEWTRPRGEIGGEWEMWSPGEPLSDDRTGFRTLRLLDNRMAQYRYEGSANPVQEAADTHAALELLIAEDSALWNWEWRIVAPSSAESRWEAHSAESEWVWAGRPLRDKEAGVLIDLVRCPDPREEHVDVSDLICAIHGRYLLRAAMLESE